MTLWLNFLILLTRGLLFISQVLLYASKMITAIAWKLVYHVFGNEE